MKALLLLLAPSNFFVINAQIPHEYKVVAAYRIASPGGLRTPIGSVACSHRQGSGQAADWEGGDGMAFDPKAKIVFTSNGADGTLTAIKEENAAKFSVLGNYATKRGGRTIAIDPETGTLFIPTADFEAAQPANGRPKMVPGSFQVLVIR